MSQYKPLRWGIFGCGKISWDFCVALSALPKSEHIITYVSARDLNRAKEFASKFGVEKYTDKYILVAEDKDVDVCYVGTINTTHRNMSVMAMNCGKAVLCEKPVAFNNEELKEILQCAQRNKVFFMEGVWTRCFPAYLDIQSKLRSGYYGEPQVLMGTFGVQDLFKLERINTPELGGGVLIDIGIYLLTVTDIIFEGHQLKDVKICSHLTEDGVDRSGSITLLFDGNRIAQLLYSGDNTLPNSINVICSKGKIHIAKPFHCPSSYTEEMRSNGIGERQTNNYSMPAPPMKMYFQNSMGLRFEAAHVRECLLAGRLESPIIPHETSSRIVALMDNLRREMKRYTVLPGEQDVEMDSTRSEAETNFMKNM